MKITSRPSAPVTVKQGDTPRTYQVQGKPVHLIIDALLAAGLDPQYKDYIEGVIIGGDNIAHVTHYIRPTRVNPNTGEWPTTTVSLKLL